MESINLTNTLAGLAAIQRAMAGEDILFTKLEIGDGVLTDTDVSGMTGLVNKTKEYVLGAVKAEDSEIVRLRSNISNAGVTQDLIIREYGIYAKFGNEQEFLFAYLNTGNVTTPLPNERIGRYELNRDFVLYIGNSLHVDFTSNGHLIYVSVNQYKDDMKGKANVEDTIEDLKASKKYNVGDIVQVLGYKKVGDGDHHKRIISTTNNGGGELLANGLYANIVHNGEINVSWLGFKENDINYDINEYIGKIQNLGAKAIFTKKMKLYTKSTLALTQSIDFLNSEIENLVSLEASDSKTGLYTNGDIKNGISISNVSIDCKNTAGKAFGFRFENSNAVEYVEFKNVAVKNVANPLGSLDGSATAIQISGRAINVICRNIIIDSVDNLLGSTIYGVIEGLSVNRSPVDSSCPDNVLIENITIKNVTEHSNNYIDPSNNGFIAETDSDALKVMTSQTTNLTLNNITIITENRYVKRGIKLQNGVNKISNVTILGKNANIGLPIDDQTGVSTVIENVQIILDNSLFSLFQSTTNSDSYSEFNSGYILRNVIINGTVFGENATLHCFLRTNSVAGMSLQTKKDFTVENVKVMTNVSFDTFIDYGRTNSNNGIVDFFTIRNVLLKNDLNKAFYSSNGSYGTEYTGDILIENFRMMSGKMVTLIGLYASNSRFYAKLKYRIIKSDVYFSNEYGIEIAPQESIYPTTDNGTSIYQYSKQRVDTTTPFPINLYIPNVIFNHSWVDVTVKHNIYTTSASIQDMTWKINISSFSDNNIVDCRIYEIINDTRNNKKYLDGISARFNKTTKILTIDFLTKPSTSVLYQFKIEVPHEFKIVKEKADDAVGLFSLNSTEFKLKMQQDGVYEDFTAYMGAKHEYDYQRRKIEKQKHLAYEESLKKNSNLAYEAFSENFPMLLPNLEEPQPSGALIAFKEKYLR